MGNHSNPKLFLTFAGWTLFAIVAVGVIIIPLRLRNIRTQAESDAAATAQLAYAPTIAGAASTSLDSFATVAQGLVGDSLLTARLWQSDGILLASVGASDPAEVDRSALAGAAGGATPASKTAAPDGSVLVSYMLLESGIVLELQQDYGLISRSVATSRRDLLITMLGGGLSLILILPLGLWAALRGLRGEYGRLLYLYRTGQAMRSTLELTNILERLARDAGLFVQADLGLVTVVEEDTNDLLVTASFMRDTDTSSQHHRKVEHWFLRRCAATARTVVTEEKAFPYEDTVSFEPKTSVPVLIYSIPIAGRDRINGILTIARDLQRGPLSASETSVLEEMAGQAAMAIEQALLFNKMRSYAEEVEVSYDTTLKVLMAALDTKDHATQGHCERVTRLTLSLAREMNVPNDRLVDIERGALLHDVGKIGVPDEILRKPDSLDDSEWEAMRQHPMLAGLMISQVGFLEGALPILLYHHERYDGGGYPFSLEGEAIPLEARIFSVIDSYDAMTSDRPYRDAMSVEEALQEVSRNAGTQFDPEVAAAFERMIRRDLLASQRAA